MKKIELLEVTHRAGKYYLLYQRYLSDGAYIYLNGIPSELIAPISKVFREDNVDKLVNDEVPSDIFNPVKEFLEVKLTLLLQDFIVDRVYTNYVQDQKLNTVILHNSV
jgi:hypothetical protein